MVSTGNSSLLSLRSSRSRATMDIKSKCNELLELTDTLIKELEPYKNEQWVLDFLDKLNKYSISY